VHIFDSLVDRQFVQILFSLVDGLPIIPVKVNPTVFFFHDQFSWHDFTEFISHFLLNITCS